ncbi:hypothetical protein FWK35_00013148 [Aphis craccivora]|nr:hypothetical protein FWK35_00013148 [Aphis craccivora]
MVVTQKLIIVNT